jgi:predicted nucleic acid-binding protein
MSYLADTDWVAEYLKGRARATQLLNLLAQEGLAISLVTYGEIYEGIYYGRDRQRHEVGLSGFLQIADVLVLNQPIMQIFAQIRGALRVQGQLIGDLDLLIAATVLHHDLTLVTGNVRHFGRIPNLKIYTTDSVAP